MLNLGLVDGDATSDFSLEQKKGFFNFHKTFKETWILVADTASQTNDDVAGDPSLPFIGQLSLRGGYCVKKSAKEVQTVIHPITGVTTILWHVTTEFDSNIDQDQAENGPPGDPTQLRPKRRWRREKIKERQVTDAITDDPIITTAGEEIVVEHDRGVAILEIERYEPYPFDPAKMFTYGDHTNEETFYGAQPGCALMDDIQTEETIVNSVLFEHVTYFIKFKFRNNDYALDNGWKAKVLNQGFIYRPFDGAHATTTKIDKNGNPVKVNLDINGGLLGTDDPPTFVEYNEFPKVSFTPLQLYF